VTDANTAGEQSVAHAGLSIEQPSELAVEGDLGTGGVARSAQVGGNRAMSVGPVQPTARSDRDEGGTSGGVSAVGELGCPQLAVELAVGHLDEPLDQLF